MRTKGYPKHYDNMWLDEQAITNIISMQNAHKRGYEIIYDNTVKYVLILTEWNGESIKFVLTPYGLYYCGMRENSVLMVNPVKENKSRYSEK